MGTQGYCYLSFPCRPLLPRLIQGCWARLRSRVPGLPGAATAHGELGIATADHCTGVASGCLAEERSHLSYSELRGVANTPQWSGRGHCSRRAGRCHSPTRIAFAHVPAAVAWVTSPLPGLSHCREAGLCHWPGSGLQLVLLPTWGGYCRRSGHRSRGAGPAARPSRVTRMGRATAHEEPSRATRTPATRGLLPEPGSPLAPNG